MKIKELKQMLNTFDGETELYFDEYEDELLPMEIDTISKNADGSGVTIRMVFI